MNLLEVIRRRIRGDVPWYKDQEVTFRDYSTPQPAELVRSLLQSDKSVYQRRLEGRIPKELDLARIFRDCGGHLAFQQERSGGEGAWCLWVWPEGYATLSATDVNDEQVSIILIFRSANQACIEKLQALVSPHITREPKTGEIKVVVKDPHGGFVIQHVGNFSNPLVRGNYTEEINRGYDLMLEELQSPDPMGRLSIMSGPPGTGKSHFLRSVAAESLIPLTLIPAGLVGSLSGPDLLPVILSVKTETELPAVLVVEDADKALVRRENGDLGGISDLLNMADGLLGELANVRIIATTNANTLQMDSALTRAGRLSQLLNFQHLSPDHANACFKNLAGREPSEPFQKPVPLADIYALVREQRKRAQGVGKVEINNHRIETLGQYV